MKEKNGCIVYRKRSFLYLIRILLYSCSIIICLSNLQAQTSLEVNSFPFTLTDHNNIAVEAVIGEVDTVDLMFHTAASAVTITEEAAGSMTGIRWNSETDVGAWGGDATARFSNSNTLSIGRFSWDSIAIWETQNSGPNTGGKFGPNLFEDKFLEINFDDGLMKIHSSLPVKAKQYEKMKIIYEDGYMFLVGVSNIEGVSFTHKFLIHSGYGGTILYDDKFVAESKIGSRIEITNEKELKDSYGNVLKVKKGKLSSFKLGEQIFGDIPVGFFEGKIGRQQMSVIGGDLLKRFNIIIDAKREFIYLRSNGLRGAPFGQL